MVEYKNIKDVRYSYFETGYIDDSWTYCLVTEDFFIFVDNSTYKLSLKKNTILCVGDIREVNCLTIIVKPPKNKKINKPKNVYYVDKYYTHIQNFFSDKLKDITFYYNREMILKDLLN